MENTNDIKRLLGSVIIEDYTSLEQISSKDESYVAPDFSTIYTISTEDEIVASDYIKKLQCPITGKIMNDPVIVNWLYDDNGETRFGSYTYEREKIEETLTSYVSMAKDLRPGKLLPGAYFGSANEKITISVEELQKIIKEGYKLIVNQDKKDEILEFIKQNPSYSEKVYLPKSWQNTLCELICNTLEEEEERINKFKYYLNKDPRLLNTPIDYTKGLQDINVCSPLFSTFHSVGCSESESMIFIKYVDVPTNNDTDYETDDNRENIEKDFYMMDKSDEESEDKSDEKFEDKSDEESEDKSDEESEDKSIGSPSNQDSLFKIAGMYGSVAFVFLILEELKKTNTVDDLINTDMSSMPFTDMALKEALRINRDDNTDFILLFKLGANISQVDTANNNLLHLAVTEDLQAEWLLTTLDYQEKALKNSKYWGMIQGLLEGQNNDGDTPLHVAIKNSCEELINLFLQYEFDKEIPNEEGNTPLHLAILNDNYNLVHKLLNLKADKYIKNILGQTSLYIASVESKLNILNLLIDTQWSDSHGHLAIEYKDDILLRYWVARQGTEIKNKVNQTLLYYAVTKGNIPAIQILLQSGADLTVISGEQKQTIFHIAANKKNILTILLDHINKVKPDLKFIFNKRDKQGNTPLYIAAQANNIEACKLLLGAGATADIPNKYNQSILELVELSLIDDLKMAITIDNSSKKIPTHLTYIYNLRAPVRQVGQYIRWSKLLSNGDLVICTDIIQVLNPSNPNDNFYLPAHSKNPQCIISLSNGDFAVVFEKNSLQIINKDNTDNNKYKVRYSYKHEAKIKYIQELEDQHLVIGDVGGIIKIISFKNGDVITRETSNQNIGCFSLVIEGKVKILAYCSKHDINIGQFIGSLYAHFTSVSPSISPITCLKLLPKYILAVGQENGDIRVINLKSKDQEYNCLGHTTEVYCLIYKIDTTNGNIYLYSGSNDGTIKKWLLDIEDQFFECEKTIYRPEARLFDHVSENIVVMYNSGANLVVEKYDLEKYFSMYPNYLEQDDNKQNCLIM